jgi:uncharacterized protein YbjT (DUF2867 family)
MKNERPILVTGAAGQLGGVGRSVTEMLLDRGLKVRALVRTDDNRATELRERGADVVVGDLLDLHAVHRAVEGCDRIYFGMSIAGTYMEAATNMAAVAKHHGVGAFVNISQMTVAEMNIQATTASPQQKQHWLAEQIFNWAELPVVEVRPTVFLDGFFLRLVAQTVSTQSKLMLPFGRGKTSAVAAHDAARVIAEILADPSQHIGKVYHLTGPVSQDLNEVAREFSEGLGRHIQYVDVPLEPWKERLASNGVPPHLVAHLAAMAILHQDGRYDRLSPDVTQLTGKPPMSVRQFVQKNAAAFAPASGS